MTPKPNAEFKHVPALDGLRGIAILSVMFFHSSVFNLQGGFIGVDIFFVLSGFLITSLIINEYDKTGDLNLKRFYIRRMFRLMPAMLFLLVCLWGAVFVLGNRFGTNPSIMLSSTLYTLFYVANWVITFGWAPWPAATTHFWSLAIEEQFYLVWPALLLAFLKFRVKAQIIVGALVGLIVLILIWRIFLWATYHNFGRVYFATDTRAGGLLAGCALAVITSNQLLPIWIKQKAGFFFFPSLLVLSAALIWANNGSSVIYNGGFELVALASCLLIMAIMYGNNKSSRLLEWKPLMWFGKLSYGIYLWHGVVFYFFEKIHFPLKESQFVLFSLQFGVSLLISFLSYTLIEKRFLRMKHKFAVKPNSMATDNISYTITIPQLESSPKKQTV